MNTETSGDRHGRDGHEVGHVLAVEDAAGGGPGAAAAAGAGPLPRSAPRATRPGHAGVPLRLALRLRHPPDGVAQAARLLGVGRRGEPTRDPQVEQQRDQRDEQRPDEQPELRPDAGPEDRVEADGLVPDGVGPQVDAHAQQEQQEHDHDDRDADPDPPQHVPPGGRLRAVVRAAYRLGLGIARRRWRAPRSRTARATAADRGGLVVGGCRAVLAGVIVRGVVRVAVGLGVVRVGVVVGVVVGRVGVVVGLVVRPPLGARRPSFGLGAAALELPHELVEQVAHLPRV